MNTATLRFFASRQCCRVNSVRNLSGSVISLRHLATAPATTASFMAATSSAPKAKPTKTPAALKLKRTASASLPIRKNPTPTRGEIQPVTTLSTAKRYQLPLLRSQLKGSKMVEDALWVPQWEETGSSRAGSSQKAQGEVWIFGNGSIVCWGLDEEAAHRLVKQVIDRPGIQVEPISEAEVEELEFVTDPTEYAF
jgi:required for meiotic nuclear division protein 1